MKISTEISSAAKLVGEEKAVELIAKAGFDAWDFSMFAMRRWDWANNRPLMTDHPLQRGDYLAFARRLKQIGLDNGIVCNQSHAPFPSRTKGMLGYLFRAIECTAEAGGKICVIHPDNNLSAEANAEMYAELLSFAKDHGIKIATENMWNWDNKKNEALPAACSDAESFLSHLHAVGDPDFVACLDIGHAEMKGLSATAPDMIRALGHHLEALHIHDNDRWHDNHQIPFSMDIDWSAVAKALADIGYRGYLTLEADSYLTAFTPETAEKGLYDLAQSARRLSDMIEKA